MKKSLKAITLLTVAAMLAANLVSCALFVSKPVKEVQSKTEGKTEETIEKKTEGKTEPKETEKKTEEPKVTEEKPGSPQTEKKTEEQVQVPAVQNDPVLENPVTDALFETVKDPYDGTAYEYRIPRVNLPGDLAKDANQKMLADGMAWLQDPYNALSDKTSIVNGDYRYSWAYQKGVVSVLVVGEYMSDDSVCFVYNVSATTGQLLSDSELLALYRIDRDTLMERLERKAEDCFVKAHRGVNSADAELKEMYDEARRFTVSKENLEQSLLFINASGDLCSVTAIGALAGSGYYYHPLNLTGASSVSFPE